MYSGYPDQGESDRLSGDLPQATALADRSKYNMVPLDDRQLERFIPEKAGRPTLIKGNTQMLSAGTGRHRRTAVTCAFHDRPTFPEAT
jgi:arylsulfatase